jgi:GNAT superfamily N-acetyltransferase
MIVAAKEKDIPAMGALLVQMHHGVPLHLPPIAPHKVEAALRHCMQKGRIFLGYKGEKLGGILGVQEGEHWFSHGRFLADLVFYVAPCARASRIASHLLRAASEYATMRGLPLLMAVVNGEDVERKDKFYARHGFTRIGGVYNRGF